MTTFDPRTRAEFHHPAFVYSDRDALLEYLLPYLHDGLEADDFIFVAAKRSDVRTLKNELGPDAERIIFADTAKWCPHPGARLNALHQMATEASDAGAANLRLAVAPIWPRRRALIYEWQRYESALNHVLSPFAGSLVCLYDTSKLDARVIEVAEATHPHVHTDSERTPSRRFEDPEEFLRRWNADAAIPASDPREVKSIDELAAIRAELQRVTTDLGLPLTKAQDMCLAANEILTNALVYGSGPVEMWTYIEHKVWFTVEVRDRGNGIDDPLIGYAPPSQYKVGGRGVWLARQVIDLVQIIPTERGTIAKLSMRV